MDRNILEDTSRCEKILQQNHMLVCLSLCMPTYILTKLRRVSECMSRDSILYSYIQFRRKKEKIVYNLFDELFNKTYTTVFYNNITVKSLLISNCYKLSLYQIM